MSPDIPGTISSVSVKDQTLSTHTFDRKEYYANIIVGCSVRRAISGLGSAQTSVGFLQNGTSAAFERKSKCSCV
jgi:hypothetical protein